MNEKERRIVVKKVNQELKQSETLERKSKELEELSKNEVIIKYLTLKKEVSELQNKIKIFENTESIIEHEFNWACSISNNFTPCEHGIWIYCGSFELHREYNSEDNFEINKIDENEYGFEYNKYTCLECGKIINTANWQEFENTHFVLKDRNITNIYEYRYLFYQLLYKHTIDKSKELLIKEFNKNSKKLSKKVINQ